MGQDKALLTEHNTALITQICTVALATTPAVHVLTPWPDRYRPHLPNCVQLHEEQQPHGGPLAALCQALSTIPLSQPWLLLLACDWVGLSEQMLQTGRQQLATLPPEAWAYLPRGHKGWEPLLGFYQVASLRQELPGAIAQGTRSFQVWLDGNPVVPWPIDITQLLNCNTPADWQTAQVRHQHNRSSPVKPNFEQY